MGFGDFFKNIFTSKPSDMSGAQSLLLSMAGGGAGVLGGELMGRLWDKIDGIPTPQPMSGGAAGRWQAAFNKSAFPGVTPWEMAGSGGSPAAQIAAADYSRKYEEKLQARQLRMQKQIADKQALSHVIGAAVGQGGDAVDQAKAALQGQHIGSKHMKDDQYWTMVDVAREKMPAEVAHYGAQVEKLVVESAVERVRWGQEVDKESMLEIDAAMHQKLKDLDLTAKQIDNITKITDRLASGIAAYFGYRRSGEIAGALRNLGPHSGVKRLTGGTLSAAERANLSPGGKWYKQGFRWSGR